MTGTFRQKYPGNIILLFILGGLLKLPVFFHAKAPVLKESDGIFYTKLVRVLNEATNNSYVVYAILAFIINMTIAFSISVFINRYRMMNKPNYLAGMAYVLITSLLASFNWLSSSLIASLFLLSAFVLFFKSYNAKYERNNIYNGAFVIGIASLFYFPAILFIAWAFIALSIVRPFKLTEWIILLMGALTPYYLFAAYLFLTDSFSLPAYFHNLTFIFTPISFSLWHAGALFFLLVPFLVGFFYMQQNASKMVVQTRKGWFLLLWYLLISILICFISDNKSLENVVILLMPAAALHGYGYYTVDLKIFPKIFFWVTVLFIVLSQIFSGLW